MRLLVVYSSRYGHTRRVAERITTQARAAGTEVHLWEVSALPERVALPKCDAAVIAGAVYWNRYNAELRDFLTRHRDELAKLPTRFVSVANAAMSEHGLPAAEEYVRKLEAQTGFKPARVLHIAGAEAYTRYGFITRWLMKRTAKKYGRTVDVEQDYDHTDWNAVDAFAAELAPARNAAEPVPA